MPRFGMTSRIIVDAWERRDRITSYETARFIAAARDEYGEVELINPNLVAVELTNGRSSPRIYHDGAELPFIDTLMIRGTKGIGPGIDGLVRALRAQGCDVLDDADSFDEDGGSKLGSSFERFEGCVGSDTYLAFGRRAATDLVERLILEGKLPLLGKPIAGRKGRGVIALHTAEAALSYVNALYDEAPTTTTLLQRLERFVAEYRVMLFFGDCLGIAKKIPATDEVAANHARGGTFIPSDRVDVEAFARKAVDPASILGVDVGETELGELVVIESNRAPQFLAFDAALGCDTARRIVQLARERLSTRRSPRLP